MSKSIKRKITVELPKPRDLSKNRLSVFQRLGTKKSKSSDSKTITDDLKQTLSAAVTITTKPLENLKIQTESTVSGGGGGGGVGGSSAAVELEDADPDLLEKKRDEIQKELELQLKMESRKEANLRKRKHRRSTSSSSSSSSSGSSSTSSTSSSSDDHRKRRLKSNKRRDTSSSSDDVHTKKLLKKQCAKKEAHKSSKSAHYKKLPGIVKNKKSSMSTSPSLKRQRLSAGSSSSTVMINSKGQKVLVKSRKLSSVERHCLHEKEKEREKEHERERLRMREKERGRSRTPKLRPKSRSPKRLSRSREYIKQRTPPPSTSVSRTRISPGKSSRYGSGGSTSRLDRRMDSRERERRDKERQDREEAREKERREALARCQERQRERERLAKEKSRRIIDDHPSDERLLPHPAEREAMALAAARGRSRDSIDRERIANQASRLDKEHLDSYGRPYEDRNYTGPRRHDNEVVVPREENFDSKFRGRTERRGDFPYREEPKTRHRGSERAEWIHHDESGTFHNNYDRNPERTQPATREWEHRNEINTTNRDSYSESREWNEPNTTKWEGHKRPPNWQSNEGENWDRYEDKWQDSHGKPNIPPNPSHGRIGIEKPNEHSINSVVPGASNMIGKGLVSRRWNTWRGRGRGSHHHSDFRRINPHHHSEIYEERGDVYRRHINPQGTKIGTPTETTTVQSGSETNTNNTTETLPTEEANKSLNDDGEEIPDDLSEISDEADEILNQQEEHNASIEKAQKIETTIKIEHQTEDQPIADVAILKEQDAIIEIKKADTPLSMEGDTCIKLEESTRSKDIVDDIELDFEEISDGELEEEARIKGLGDALGVDWASLVEDSKTITQQKTNQSETSAKQRWQAHCILLDVGVSQKMAGKKFAQKVLLDAHYKLSEEKIAFDDNKTLIIKKELDDNNVDDTNSVKNIENTIKFHEIACAQAANRIANEQKQNIIFNATGPYSRALCAKRDIAMRRKLFNLPINENNCKIMVNRQPNDYVTIAKKLFQKSLTTTN